MTAPLNLDVLEAAARAANREGWYEKRDIGHNNCLFASGGNVDTDHIIAASPAAVLALIERLRTAEADAEHYRKLAGELRKQQMGAVDTIKWSHVVRDGDRLVSFDPDGTASESRDNGKTWTKCQPSVEAPHG